MWLEFYVKFDTIYPKQRRCIIPCDAIKGEEENRENEEKNDHIVSLYIFGEYIES